MAYQKRLTILLDSEVKDLFGIPIYSIEEQRVYFALNDVEAKVVNAIQDRLHRCFFIVLLGYFKTKPICLNPNFGDVENDLRFVAQEHFPGLKLRRFSLTQKQKDRFYLKIFELIRYQVWSVDHYSIVITHLQKIAQSYIEPRYIFDACIEFLVHKRIAIPKYSVLQRLVSQTIKLEKIRISQSLKKAMSWELSSNLTDLIDGNSSLTMRQLRQAAKSFNAPELQKELNVYQLTQPWADDIKLAIAALSLSVKNQQHFASMIDYYSITKLQRFDRLTQQLYVLCYLQERTQQNIERLADGFSYHVRKLREQATAYAKEMAYKDWEGAAANVSKAAQLLRLFIDDAIDDQQSFAEVKQQAHRLLKSRDIESLCLYLNKQKRALDDYHWEYYDQQHELLYRLLRPIFLCLSFSGTDKNAALVKQLTISKTELKGNGMLTIIDHGLIDTKHRPYVLDVENNVNVQRYEILLYTLIQHHLDGQLYIPTSIKYRALQDDLVNNAQWENKQHLLKSAMLPRLNANPETLIRLLENDLKTKLLRVSQRIDNGENENVLLKKSAGKTGWRLPSMGIKSTVNNPFFDMMKPINVADILRLVDRETDFLSHFEHVRQVQSGQNNHINDLLAAIIGNGTNYGLYGMASISDRSYEQLRTVQANYLRPETLSLANDAINNATARLAIFKHYNIQEGLIHASADGQKFESRLETFKTRYSSKYFGTNKGVSALTLIANHAALNARVIGSNEHESHFIFDLLYNNTSDIKPDVLSTDTHGVNHVNFALLDLFGYTFAPRYAQFGTVIADLFDVNESKENKLSLSLKSPIKTDLIIEQWDTIQRIAISLQQKTITQGTLVRKLSGYSNNHPLLKALTEYNRMIKAMYLLDYIDDVSLRNYVQRALNRGEAYHQLRRAIASVNGNRFRGSSDYEIELWNECARLLTNAIIYFNSLILTRLLTHFEGRNDQEKLKITKQVSPVAWHNINLNGTYSFNFEQKLLDLDKIMQPIMENESN